MKQAILCLLIPDNFDSHIVLSEEAEVPGCLRSPDTEDDENRWPCSVDDSFTTAEQQPFIGYRE